MSLTAEDLQAQRDVLMRAMGTGALMVQHGDKTVKYRSAADLAAALATIDYELSMLSGKRKRRVRYFSIHKDLG